MRRLSEVIFRGISLTIVAASLGVSGCAASSDQEPAPSVSWEERKIHDAVTGSVAIKNAPNIIAPLKSWLIILK